MKKTILMLLAASASASPIISHRGCECKPTSEVIWPTKGGGKGGGMSHHGCGTGPYEQYAPAQGRPWCDTVEGSNCKQGWDYCTPQQVASTPVPHQQYVPATMAVQVSMPGDAKINSPTLPKSSIRTKSGCTCQPFSEVILIEDGQRIGGGLSHQGCGTGKYEDHSPGKGQNWCDVVESWCNGGQGWDYCDDGGPANHQHSSHNSHSSHAHNGHGHVNANANLFGGNGHAAHSGHQTHTSHQAHQTHQTHQTVHPAPHGSHHQTHQTHQAAHPAPHGSRHQTHQTHHQGHQGHQGQQGYQYQDPYSYAPRYQDPYHYAYAPHHPAPHHSGRHSSHHSSRGAQDYYDYYRYDDHYSYDHHDDHHDDGGIDPMMLMLMGGMGGGAGGTGGLFGGFGNDPMSSMLMPMLLGGRRGGGGMDMMTMMMLGGMGGGGGLFGMPQAVRVEEEPSPLIRFLTTSDADDEDADEDADDAADGGVGAGFVAAVPDDEN